MCSPQCSGPFIVTNVKPSSVKPLLDIDAVYPVCDGKYKVESILSISILFAVLIVNEAVLKGIAVVYSTSISDGPTALTCNRVSPKTLGELLFSS